jgi:hypothetical protein
MSRRASGLYVTREQGTCAICLAIFRNPARFFPRKAMSIQETMSCRQTNTTELANECQSARVQDLLISLLKRVKLAPECVA